MNTVAARFHTTVRQMTKMFQWPICLSKQWPKRLSEKKPGGGTSPECPPPRVRAWSNLLSYRLDKSCCSPPPHSRTWFCSWRWSVHSIVEDWFENEVATYELTRKNKERDVIGPTRWDPVVAGRPHRTVADSTFP